MCFSWSIRYNTHRRTNEMVCFHFQYDARCSKDGDFVHDFVSLPLETKVISTITLVFAVHGERMCTVHSHPRNMSKIYY